MGFISCDKATPIGPVQEVVYKHDTVFVTKTITETVTVYKDFVSLSYLKNTDNARPNTEYLLGTITVENINTEMVMYGFSMNISTDSKSTKISDYFNVDDLYLKGSEGVPELKKQYVESDGTNDNFYKISLVQAVGSEKIKGSSAKYEIWIKSKDFKKDGNMLMFMNITFQSSKRLGAQIEVNTTDLVVDGFSEPEKKNLSS